MILNARNSNFNFIFPKTWIFKDVVDRYDIFIKKYKADFIDVSDFLSSTIQSLSWPEISAEIIKMSYKDVDKTFKSGKDGGRLVAKEFTLTFKLSESFVNYFIMLDQYFQYMEWDTVNKPFVNDLYLHILDEDGYLMFQLRFEDVTYNKLSGLDLNFSNNNFDFKTFTADFSYKDLYIDRENIFNGVKIG